MSVALVCAVLVSVVCCVEPESAHTFPWVRQPGAGAGKLGGVLGAGLQRVNALSAGFAAWAALPAVGLVPAHLLTPAAPSFPAQW